MSTQTNQVKLDFLYDFAKGDTEKIKKYVSMYLKTAPEIILRLQELLESNDLEALKRSAHSVKSQAKYMGADDLSQVMQDIELKSSDKKNKELLHELVKRANDLNLSVNENLVEHLQKL